MLRLLFCLAITAHALVINKQIPSEGAGKNYAYVTMFIHPEGKGAKLLNKNHMSTEQVDQQMDKWAADKEAGKAVPAHYNREMKVRSDKTMKLKVVSQHGDGKSFDSCEGCKQVLRLAKDLQKSGSKYPLVVITNVKHLIQKGANSSSGMVIRELQDDEFLKRTCEIKKKNELHFQKLMVFNMTQYEKMIWMDTDIHVRKNVDHLFEEGEDQVITGQYDDWGCDGKISGHADKSGGGFCSGVMRFQPSQEHFQGLLEHQAGMKECWGDQAIIQEYFSRVSMLTTFDTETVSFNHCFQHKNTKEELAKGYAQLDSALVHQSGEMRGMDKDGEDHSWESGKKKKQYEVPWEAPSEGKQDHAKPAAPANPWAAFGR